MQQLLEPGALAGRHPGKRSGVASSRVAGAGGRRCCDQPHHQTRHLGQPLAYLVTESGNVNQYIHIWVYENAADREKRRAAMWADAEWVAYTQESARLGALDAQENRLMTPVEFFPLKR